MTSILTGPAGRALDTIRQAGIDAPLDIRGARDLINSARGDVARALGGGRTSSFMAEMHAASRNLHSGARAAGGDAFSAGIRELEVAARRTATGRMAIGALALGGAIGGAVLLARALGGGNGDSQPMAPGPLDAPTVHSPGTLA